VASTSGQQHFLVESELTEVVNAIKSENEYPEVSDLESYCHGDESDCVVTDQPSPQHPRKTNNPSPPSFQWQSGVLCPVTHIAVIGWCVVSSLAHFSGTVVCCVQSRTFQWHCGVLCPVTHISIARWCVLSSHKHSSGTVVCCVQSHTLQ
jgi:hypothetical protein